MGLFGKRNQYEALPGYEVPEEFREFLERTKDAPPYDPPIVYWIREPGDSWHTHSLWNGETHEDMVRFYPEGTEFELAQPPGRDA
jgi:hypothetical protein